MTYFGAGIIALIIGVLTWFTLAEPARQSIGEEENKENANVKKITIWDVIRDPRVIMLVLAASIRHCGKSLVNKREKLAESSVKSIWGIQLYSRIISIRSTAGL